MVAQSEQRCSQCGEPVGTSLGGSVCAACFFEQAINDTEANDAGAEIVAPERPRTFGQYELLEEIGRGGMGVVYRARQQGLDRIVALKMLVSGEFADESSRKRLIREAKAVGRLSHANIVGIHEVGEFDGRPYFAMEYVAGRSLAEAVRDGPLALAQVAAILFKLAHAVHYAHSQGVIHRDLKPANVLLDDRGEPKLTDFGLTKTELDLTLTLASAGSPNFMAPEQASRDLGPTGPHTDVFGLGGILYYLLTGQAPFPGAMLGETIRAVLEDDPIGPRVFRADTPPDLETICLKCLRKSPAERYRSALELAEDLQRFLRWEPIRARRISALGRFARWSRRNPAWATLLIFSFTALIAVTFQWRRAKSNEYIARQNAYAAQMLLAHQRYDSFKVGGAIDLLNELRPKPGEPDFRGFEWAYLYRLCHQETQVIPVGGRNVYFMQFSPSGKYLLAAVSNWPENADPDRVKIQLFKPLASAKPIDFSVGEMRFAISPDEKWVAALQPTNIVIRHFPSGSVHQILDGHDRGAKVVAFSPNGKTLASGGADQMVRLWDLGTGTLIRAMLANTNGGPFCLAWDLAGSRIFSGGGDGLVYTFDVSTGQAMSLLRGHSDYVYCLALSPDGQTLATGGGDRRILLWDTATGQQRGELRGHGSYIYSLAFSPDGRQLASASWDNTVRLWDPNQKTELRILRGSRSFAFSLAYSPDGQTIASGGDDGTIRLWDPTHDATQNTLLGASNVIGALQWSSKADWLLTSEWVSGRKHIYRAWDVESRQPVRSWESVTLRHVLNRDCVFLQGTNRLPVFFDPVTRAELPILDCTEPLVDFQYSPDRKRIATVSPTSIATLWKDLSQPPLRTVQIPSFEPGTADSRVQFSPDSRWFITTSPDCKIQVWDARNGRLRTSFARAPAWHGAIEISPDSRLLLALDSNGYNVWELETGKRPFLIPNLQSHAIGCFSRDSKSVLTGKGALFELRDVRTGRIRYTLKGHHGTALTSTFSPNGDRIATAGDDHTIKIWNAENGRELLSISGHSSETYCLAFSPDGRHLASAGRDRTVRIWSAATEDEIARWEAEDRHLSEPRLFLEPSAQLMKR